MIEKIVTKDLGHDKVRFVVAVGGVAAAVGLLTWSLGLTVTSMRQSPARAAAMTAPFDAWVTSEGVGLSVGRRGGGRRPQGAGQGIPEPVLASLDTVPGVLEVHPYSVLSAPLDYRPEGRVMQGPPLVAGLVSCGGGNPYRGVTVEGQWPEAESDEPLAAVSEAVFSPRGLAPPPLGSSLVLITPNGTVTVKISAILRQHETVRGFPTVFASDAVMRRVLGDDWRRRPPNLALCRLRRAADVNRLRQVVSNDAAPSSRGSSPGLHVVDRKHLAGQLADDKLRNFKRQAPLLLTLTTLTAFCMLFNTLTLGLDRKLRTMALLRTVGMTARQVARMVVFESFLTAALGWLIGTLGGRLLLEGFVRRMPETFPVGAAMGWGPPAGTAALALAIAGIACWHPCRVSLRIRPLDLLPDRERTLDTPSRRKTWLGLALLLPLPLLALPWNLSPLSLSLLLLLVGLPSHLAGLVLCLPALIRWVEQGLTPLLSRMLALDARLLRRRCSRDAARVTIMVLTLAVGLGTFIAIHVWGGSMMAPFVPSPEFPDAIVSILPRGIPRETLDTLPSLEGVRDGRCLALEAEQFPLDESLTRRIAEREGRRPQVPNVLLCGADPARALGGDRPLAAFRFVAGDAATASAAMTRNRGCVITRMFARQSGLGLGDRLTLRKRAHPGTGPSGAITTGQQAQEASPSFEIAGIVDLNWHLVTSRAQLRGRHGMPPMTLGPVFVSEEAARAVSGNFRRTYFLWANFSENYRKLGPLTAGQRLERDLRERLEIGDDNTIRVHHRDEIEDGTIAHGNQLIGDMARAPFWSLIVLCTGMVTLIIAAFQAARHEIVIMRAVGMTRHQLGRMLLAEALLTAVCGVLVSLLSGLCIGWAFTGWTRAWMPFGGLPATLSVPWNVLFGGIGFALLLCLLMAMPPVLWLTRKMDWMADRV